MSDNKDERLEQMLRARRLEAASPDLAARIILQAKNLPQLQSVSLWQALRQAFAEFHLPKPAYVLASALVVGMVMGFTLTPDSFPTNDEILTTTQNYIDADEGLL
jgi:ABC-type uncharacterized transport system permease subunit